MGVGFIQLVAVGNEINIFNHNPNISFFKTYYRRYSNFFINNMTIEGNNVGLDNNNFTLNKEIYFKIPKNGDLLGKSYVELDFGDYYFEMLGYDGELFSTLNTNILNLYDSYYIKTNEFGFDDIGFIKIIKINYYHGTKYNDEEPYFVLVSSNINNNILHNILSKTNGIELETDKSDIFYNLNLINNFYSFNVFDINIKANELFLYLIAQINAMSLEYIQIDIPEQKISFRITYNMKIFYEELLNLVMEKDNIMCLINMKIADNYVYISIKYLPNLFSELMKLFFINSEILELEIIRDKLKSNKMTILTDITNKMSMLVLNKNSNTWINFAISNRENISYGQLTIMINSVIFGNLTNDYYNDFLISDSNSLLDVFNLTNNKMSLNLLIRLYITLTCSNNKPSIQEYLKIANGIGNASLDYYQNDMNKLNSKILEVLMNPNLIILSNRCFNILNYTSNTYKYYNELKYSQPFTDKKISIYSSVITNSYLFNSFITSFSNYFNQTSNDTMLMISQLLFLINYMNVETQNAIYYNKIQINYINNNNLFNLTNIENKNVIQTMNNNFTSNIIGTKNLYLILMINYLSIYITQSLTLLNSISNKPSNFIYNSNGTLTSLFNNNANSLCVIPLSSNICVYTNNSSSQCSTTPFTNNEIYFNKSLNLFISTIQLNLSESINQLMYNFKVNIKNNVSHEISSELSQTQLIHYAQNYYENFANIVINNNMSKINDFLENIKTINYSEIYNTNGLELFDLNSEIMYEIFSYTDTNLFNNTFSNFRYDKENKCNTPVYNTTLKIELNYLKFIFSINSPIYRIYFLFTFLSKYTIDSNYNGVESSDDVSTLRDFCLMFVSEYLNYANEFDISQFNVIENLSKFSFKYIYNQDNILSNNVICFDEISFAENNDFLNTIKNKNSSSYFLMYNNFYFIQKKVNNLYLNLTNLNDIPNYCNNLKYNYDDNIIILFLKELKSNNKFFSNFSRVYDFALNFFNKYEYNLSSMLKSFNFLVNYGVNTTSNVLPILQDEFYNQCYYATFILGSTFDNIYLNNITTINDIFNSTLSYNLEYDYEYCITSYNIKQNINYASNDNIFITLNYFLSQMFSVLNSQNKTSVEYYGNYINSLINYINSNISFLYLYVITEYNFNGCVSIINKYISKFNSANNSNVSLTHTNTTTIYNKTNFSKYNFIVIVNYYIYFIYTCLSTDIKLFNEQNNTTIYSFQKYVIAKYTTNIYYECIKELITLFEETLVNEIIDIDFSSYYFYGFLSNESILNNNANNFMFDVFSSTLDYNYMSGFNYEIQYKNTTDRLTYNVLNNSSCIFINSLIDENYNLTQITSFFNKLYYDQIYSLVSKINKLIVILNDKNYYKKIEALDNSTSLTLIDNYTSVKNYYYSNSQLTIYDKIYKNLYESFNYNVKNFKTNNYSYRICSYLLDIINKFYSAGKENYFYTMYYFNDDKLPIHKSNILLKDIIQQQNQNKLFSLANLTNSLEELNKSISFSTFYSQYIDHLIMNSLQFEKEINRIIYLECTNYLINTSFDKKYIREQLSSKTLYDIVKLYMWDKDEDGSKFKKRYLTNTAIYSSQSVFQILNYNNMTEATSMTQNYWINELFANIEIEPNLSNSYYKKYLEFVEYVTFFNLDTKSLVLENGLSVLEYFTLLTNYDELTTIIYDYACLNEYMSPINIFVNIVQINKSDEINSKLDIDINRIKKKIVVYLFFNYIILSNIPKLLVKNFDVDLRIVLEYSVGNMTYDVKLCDVLKIPENIKTIEWAIWEIYNMMPNLSNKTLFIDNIPPFIADQKDVIYIVRNAKLYSSVPYYNLLAEKYVHNYNVCIGQNNNINTTSLINTIKSLDNTITNLVSNINIVFNNDMNINNPAKYDLTFYSMGLIDIKLNSIIYALDDTNNNRIYNVSQYSLNSKKNYTRTCANDYNLLFSLECLLLDHYGITYSNLNDDTNDVLENIRLGEVPINNFFEIAKGYVSNYMMSLNLTSNEKTEKYNNIISRINNIDNLSRMITQLNNLSLITPNDYDDIIILFDYGKADKNFFEKYYSYQYNYNNFNNNNYVIYSKLYEYYVGISTNTNSITNIKSSDINLYVNMFIDLINSFIGILYYDINIYTNEPNSYIDNINKINKLYFKYNYTFRLNQSISNVNNLLIQNQYNNVGNITSYEQIYNLLIGYYYYQLFSLVPNLAHQQLLTQTQLFTKSDYTTDVINFFNTLNNPSNSNFYYSNNFLNLVLKFEIIIKYILYRLNSFYGLNIDAKQKDKYISQLSEEFTFYFINVQSISDYFNQKYMSQTHNDMFSNILFNTIINSRYPTEIYNKFSLSICKLIYWVNSMSYEQNLTYVWNEFFKNYTFEYFVYVDNNYKIEKSFITYNDFCFMVQDYINYVMLRNNNLTEISGIKIQMLYDLIFGYIGIGGTKKVVRPNVILNILYGKDEEIQKDIFIENEYVSGKLNEKYINVEKDDITPVFVFETICTFILNTKWGTIDYNNIDNKPNYKIKSYIMLYNYYYTYLTWLLNKEEKMGVGEYNFDSNYVMFNELYILYYFILITITCNYVNNETNNTLLDLMLSNANTFIQNGKKISCLNPNNNFSIFMDKLNSCMIKQNYISNYYKDIQNNSIYDCVKYNVQNFTNNENNYDTFMTQIYNSQINKLNFNSENIITYNSFYNQIINILSNYTSDVELYGTLISKILSNINNVICEGIKRTLIPIKKYLGGENLNGIVINNSLPNNLFSTENYKKEQNQITALTLIYNQVNSGNFASNLPVMLFYYVCLITWTTLGVSIEFDTKLIENIFYGLTNLINKEIMSYLTENSLNNSKNNSQINIIINVIDNLNEHFFNGLNKILFTHYNNYEYVIEVQNFFTNCVYNFLQYKSNTLVNNFLSNNLFQNANKTFNKNYYGFDSESNLEANLTQNMSDKKIINWKYLLGLFADFNNSINIKNIKSINNVFGDTLIQSQLINWIMELIGGLVNNYGIVKMINRMELLFSDELIVSYSGFNYKIFVDNFQNINKQKLLDAMLGLNETYPTNIISGIKPYIKFSYQRKYIIPVKFFFENYFNSIPLINCMYSDIGIKLYLNNTSLFKNFYQITNLTKINIATKLNSDYILVERDERKMLCEKKIDNLIERYNCYEVIKKIFLFDNIDLNKVIDFENKSQLISNDVLSVNFDFELDNMVKELIWTFSLTINDFNLDIIKDYNITLNDDNYMTLKLNNLSNNVPDLEFITNTKFLLDGARRDGINSLDGGTIFTSYNTITTTLNPYKYNIKTNLNKNYNTYSFALEPMIFQPSGAINMSNIKVFTIQIKISKLKLLLYLKRLNVLFNLNDIVLKMNLATYEYNLVRYQSGLAGLLFVK